MEASRGSIMPVPDEATIHSLRRDLALQVSRAVRQLGATQVLAARQLGVPQPTLSKVINGRVENLSIELLIRIAVRAGLSLTLHTGGVAEEAGVFVSTADRSPIPGRGKSRLADEARQSLQVSDRRLTPSQRLEAFLEHNQLLAELQQAGRVAETLRAGKAGHTR
jgi:predicted XRE-type DNA-binding protein